MSINELSKLENYMHSIVELEREAVEIRKRTLEIIHNAGGSHGGIDVFDRYFDRPVFFRTKN